MARQQQRRDGGDASGYPTTPRRVTSASAGTPTAEPTSSLMPDQGDSYTHPARARFTMQYQAGDQHSNLPPNLGPDHQRRRHAEPQRRNGATVGSLSGGGGTITGGGFLTVRRRQYLDHLLRPDFRRDGADQGRQRHLHPGGRQYAFTGPITISAGAIQLGNPNSLAASSLVSVNVSQGLLFGSGVTAANFNVLNDTGNLALTNADGSGVALTVTRRHPERRPFRQRRGTARLDHGQSRRHGPAGPERAEHLRPAPR